MIEAAQFLDFHAGNKFLLRIYGRREHRCESIATRGNSQKNPNRDVHGRIAIASVRFMTEMNWYTDASLSSETHVFTAGSLAQCVRRWTRLHESHRARTRIKIGGRTGHSAYGLPVLDEAEILALASKPDLYKV